MSSSQLALRSPGSTGSSSSGSTSADSCNKKPRPNLFVDTRAMPRKYKRKPIGWEPPAKNLMQAAYRVRRQEGLWKIDRCRTFVSLVTFFGVFAFFALNGANSRNNSSWEYDEHLNPNQLADVGYRGHGHGHHSFLVKHWQTEPCTRKKSSLRQHNYPLEAIFVHHDINSYKHRLSEQERKEDSHQHQQQQHQNDNLDMAKKERREYTQHQQAQQEQQVDENDDMTSSRNNERNWALKLVAPPSLFVPNFPMGIQGKSLQDEGRVADVISLYSRMQDDGTSHQSINGRVSLAMVMDPWKREALQWNAITSACARTDTPNPRLRATQKDSLGGDSAFEKEYSSEETTDESILSLCNRYPTAYSFFHRSEQQDTFATSQLEALCPAGRTTSTSPTGVDAGVDGSVVSPTGATGESLRGVGGGIQPSEARVAWRDQILSNFDQVLLADRPIESKVLLHLKYGVPFALLPNLPLFSSPPDGSKWNDPTDDASGEYNRLSKSEIDRIAGGRLRQDLEMYQFVVDRFRTSIAMYPNFERYRVLLRAVEENLKRYKCESADQGGDTGRAASSKQGDEALVLCTTKAIRAVSGAILVST
jgi:hypothetical protein